MKCNTLNQESEVWCTAETSLYNGGVFGKNEVELTWRVDHIIKAKLLSAAQASTAIGRFSKAGLLE